MKISEIPYPKVKAAAEKNQQFPGDHLAGAFAWIKSPEGYSFWKPVNNGWWAKAKEICPHLFEEEKTGKQKALDKLLIQWDLEFMSIPKNFESIPVIATLGAKFISMVKALKNLPENRFDSEGNVLPEEKPVLAYQYEWYVLGKWHSITTTKAPHPNQSIRNLVELVAK